MIFVLGVCVAGLLALLCLPAISRRALRMAQVAVERQMPISVDEIVAQRDLLRAEFATERRRLEQTLEHTRDMQAREMSDAGRRTAEIARLGAELATVSAARENAETALAAAVRLANEAGVENAGLHKALYDADGMEARLREELASLARQHREAMEEDRRKTGSIAALHAASDLATTEHEALDRALMQAKLDLSIARAREETLLAQIDNHERAAQSSAATQSALQQKIMDYERNTTSVTTPDDTHAGADLDMLRRTIVEIGHEVVRLAERHHAPVVGSQEARPTASVN